MKAFLIIAATLLAIGLVAVVLSDAGPSCSKVNDCVGVGK